MTGLFLVLFSNPIFICFFLLMLFLPGQYALRLLAAVLFVAPVAYGFLAPSVVSAQATVDTGLLVLFIELVAFVMLSILRVSAYLALRYAKGLPLYWPLAIDYPVLAIIGTATSMTIVTTVAGVGGLPGPGVLAHMFIGVLASLPIIFLTHAILTGKKTA
jgi:hypothetical protein